MKERMAGCLSAPAVMGTDLAERGQWKVPVICEVMWGKQEYRGKRLGSVPDMGQAGC